MNKGTTVETVSAEPLRLTHRQVRLHFEEIKGKMCRVWHPEYGYLNREGGWSGSDLEKARCMTVETYLCDYGMERYLCEMLDQGTAKRLSDLPVKLCDFEQVLPKLSALLKLCPNNPTYRALLSQKVRQSAPTELTTYEQVKDWVEHHYDSGYRPPAPASSRSAADRATTPPTHNPQNQFRVELNLSDTELGRCRYRVYRFGMSASELTMEQLAELMDGCDEVDDLLNAVFERASDEAWQDADMEGEDYDYNDHESSEIENSETEWVAGRGTMLDRLTAFLHQNATREQLEQLGLEVPF